VGGGGGGGGVLNQGGSWGMRGGDSGGSYGRCSNKEMIGKAVSVGGDCWRGEKRGGGGGGVGGGGGGTYD